MSAAVYLGRQQIFMNLKNGAHIVEHVVHLFRRNFAGHLTKLFLFLFRFRGFSSVGKAMPRSDCQTAFVVTNDTSGAGNFKRSFQRSKAKSTTIGVGRKPSSIGIAFTPGATFATSFAAASFASAKLPFMQEAYARK